jgi:nucleoside 2-deoxyribosyltransferase
VVADLSNQNNGAYWEAGFAEGLGKPVIYICRAADEYGEEIATHFDASHRHTVKWDLAAPADFAIRLKAVIRNTLLGDANQSD